MNHKTKIVGVAVVAVVIILAVIAFAVSKKAGEEKMEETKNLAMYVPYGDDSYIMVDQETGSIYTITMPDNIYGKKGEKLPATDLKKGNIVAIYGNGIMLESYPGQYPGVTKVEIVEEGKESDADQYQDIIDGIYQEPNPADRPTINIEYRTESAVVSSIATEGNYEWNYTDADGQKHSESTDSLNILTIEDLIDLTIDEKKTNLSFTFTLPPEEVQVVRWPVELRESSQSASKFPEGEAVEVAMQDKAYVVSDVIADYVYKVTATWEQGTVEYGFYTKTSANKSNTEDVDQFAKEMKEKVGDSVSLPSEYVTKVIAKKWVVADSDDIYEMKTDGSGTKNDEAFTFECGFDDENHITLEIKMKDSEKKKLYAISTDTTGYGINLTALDNGKDLYLLPSDLEFLEVNDERVAGIIGEWADASGNKYTFKKDNTVKIKGSESNSKGTYSVVKNTEGTLLLNMAVSGGALEFEYFLSDDKKTMELSNVGTDSSHTWTKQ